MRLFGLFNPLTSALALALLLFARGAGADDVRIAAVVNDQVISVADLDARVGLSLASSNIPDDADTRAKIEPQVLRQMIDEKLEMLEAKKEGVNVSGDELKKQLDGLARMNKIDPANLDTFLASHKIDKEALSSQITAQIEWSRVVQRRYGYSVSVGEEEVSEALKTALAEREKPQNRVAEIFLNVESPSQDGEVHQLADRLFEEIQRGARFEAVARQFSQSATAAVGGDIGWVVPGMLDIDVQKVIDTMQPGTMTHPLRMAGGYYIYLLIDRRTPESNLAGVKVDLTQVVFPMAADADEATQKATQAKATAATADMHSCGEMAKLGKQTSPDLSGPIGNVTVAELPAELRSSVSNQALATPTTPIAVRGGIGVFMVCHRSGGAPTITRDQVENNLRSVRLENIARRYLSDLHRVAYIDLRV